MVSYAVSSPAKSATNRRISLTETERSCTALNESTMMMLGESCVIASRSHDTMAVIPCSTSASLRSS